MQKVAQRNGYKPLSSHNLVARHDYKKDNVLMGWEKVDFTS